MTTIVLVTIGILLAAASALMVTWYGGTAFDQGHINADAARLLTEGSQIERAVGLYRAQEGRTPDVADNTDPLKPLITKRYLADAPSGDIGRWFVDYPSGMIRADVGAADDTRALMVCRAARRSQRLPNPSSVYHCDGSDYPFSHPSGSLPAVEPCCVFTGATAADIAGGRGSASTGGATAGGNGGTTDPNYNPVGSTNSYSCSDRVDFLRRSFDAVQTGTKAFYLKYHQITTIEQLVDMGFVPAWAMTAKSGDYSNPSVETGWNHSPWPDINAGKPYVHVNLTDDVFSCFATTWNSRYGSQSTVDNYYGNHLSERISLPLFPTDVSTITSALDETTAAIAKYQGDKGFIPRSVSAMVSEGYLTGLPTSGYGVTSGEYVMTSRSQSDHDSQGDSRAIGMVLNSEEACRAFNVKSYGVDEVPVWGTHDRGCAKIAGQVTAYSYVAGATDPSTWYPYDEMATGNPSPHFVYTSSQPTSMAAFDGTKIAVSGYTYWGLYRQNTRFTMHPGPTSPDTTTLRFVAPQAGTYRLRGAWQPIGGCGNGVDLSVSGLGSRYGDSSQPWTFDFQRSLSAGGTVEFTLGNRGNDNCDGTYLDLVVEFQGQTKDRLATAEAQRIVEQAIKDPFDHWLSGNPVQANKLLDFVLERADERLRRRAEKETSRKTAVKKLRLPGKLADCTNTATEGSELFIVEGDSAGGSAKQARDRKTQAILPLRGKILNVASATRDKLTANQQLSDLMQAIGCGTGAHYREEDLRYSRVIIMTDADVDGAHIASLLITFFYRQMPKLIDEGHLYLAVPPLYRLTHGSKTVYARNEAHRDALLKSEFNANAKVDIGRFKGLGEMMPAQLKETTMDPSRRTLLRVQLLAEDREGTADSVERLMGTKAEARFAFISDKAEFASDELLDV